MTFKAGNTLLFLTTENNRLILRVTEEDGKLSNYYCVSKMMRAVGDIIVIIALCAPPPTHTHLKGLFNIVIFKMNQPFLKIIFQQHTRLRKFLVHSLRTEQEV